MTRLGSEEYEPNARAFYESTTLGKGSIRDFISDVFFSRLFLSLPLDLKEGTNYCAKYIQTSAATSEAKDWTATIEWIAMPTATHDNVEAAIKTTTFADLFDSEDCLANKSGQGADGVCPTDGFKSVNTGGYGCECLKVKPGKEALAGTLEKRRYAGVS